MKSKRALVIIIVSLALIIAALPLVSACAKPEAPAPAPAPTPAPLEKVIEWRCDTIIQEWRAVTKDYMAWADRITTRSDGQLVMTVYPGGALGFNMADVLRVLKAGTVEASMTSPHYLIRDAAPLGLLVVQGIFKERKDYLKQVEAMREVKTKIYADWDVVFLGQFPADDSIIGLWSNKPVNSLEDMRGMKIRCFDKYQGMALIETGAGISTPTIPMADMYMAMKTGVVDGVLFPPSAGKGLGLADISKYCTVLYPYADDGMDLIVSKTAWDTLSPELQEIVLEAARWWEQYAIDNYLDAEADEKLGREYCEANDMTFTWLPEAERAKIREAAFKVWKEETEKIGGDATWAYEKLFTSLGE